MSHLEQVSSSDEPSSTTIVPRDSQTWSNLRFSTSEAAFQFYKDYAHSRGFGARIDKQVKKGGKNVSMDQPFYLYYCCNKEGFRKDSLYDPKNAEKTKNAESESSTKSSVRVNPEERIGCTAVMNLRFELDKEQYYIVKWLDDHNHDLHPTKLAHMIRSNRHISEYQVEVAKSHMSAGLSVKSSFQLMTQAAGGKELVGFIKPDLKNHFRSERREKMAPGILNVLLEFLRDESMRKPSFFYEIRLDENDLVTSIFWSDGEMQHDYSCFGDFVSLDTTFRTNNTYRPLAAFIGFSHHRQSCIFGAALLFDQSTDTFTWLLHCFLKCMLGKHPVTIFTDQDQALGNAVGTVFPNAFHGLCTWHICKNAAINLSALHTNEFRRDFSFLINEVDNELEFNYNWKIMVDEQFGGIEHKWLNYIYPFRRQWSSAWVKSCFSAGAKTTQLSESFNALLRDYTCINHSLVEFFHHFNMLLDDMREKLNKSVFYSIQYLPDSRFIHSPFVNQVSTLYTPVIFKLFQDEYSLTHMYYVMIDQSSDLVMRKMLSVFRFDPVDMNLKLDVCRVVVDLEGDHWSCSCRKFENWGILCRHIMKGVDILGSSGCYPQLRRIPDKYILKRWTRTARGDMSTWSGPGIGGGHLSSYTVRYQEFCSTMIRVGTRICMHDDVYMTFMKDVQGALARAEEKINAPSLISAQNSTSKGSSNYQASSTFHQIKGLKAKENPNKAKSRLKSTRDLAIQKLKSKRKSKREDDESKDLGDDENLS